VLEHGTNRLARRFMPRMFRLLADSMVFKDDPDHLRLRRLVNKAFTPKRVQQMSDDIERTVDRLVEDLAHRDGPVDLMDELAVPLPLSVIATMLGVSDRDRDEFHTGVKTLIDGFSAGPTNLVKAIPATRRLMKLFDRLAAARRAEPDDGLITALVRANDEGDQLGDDEVIAMIFLLLLAGHDTTANLIGNGVLALIDHPDQRARLRSEPSLIDAAVEELLRFTGPVACGATRYALDDIELSGVAIPKGAQVLGMIISANRDEDVFEDAEALDIGREPNRHIAFAFGAHYCLGNQLARLEGRFAIKALGERFPDMTLAIARDSVRYKPTPSLRGPSTLPLLLGSHTAT
jgi:cytochrome P450 PksS